MKLLTARNCAILGPAVAASSVAVAKRRGRNEFDRNGKVVLITGGSRGFGLAMAREFAEQGSRLVLCARDADRRGMGSHVPHECIRPVQGSSPANGDWRSDYQYRVVQACQPRRLCWLYAGTNGAMAQLGSNKACTWTPLILKFGESALIERPAQPAGLALPMSFWQATSRVMLPAQ
jgi:hypothetical protein